MITIKKESKEKRNWMLNFLFFLSVVYATPPPGQSLEPGGGKCIKCQCEAWRETCDSFGLKCERGGLVDVNSQRCTTNFRYTYCPKGPDYWYFNEAQGCHCPPEGDSDYKGIECQLSTPKRCQNLTTAAGEPMLFDGSYLNPASPTKQVQCFVKYTSTTSSIFDLINHRVDVQLRNSSVSFALSTRTRPYGPDTCGYVVDALTCELTQCETMEVVTNDGPTSRYSCNKISCSTCNEKLCKGYQVVADLLSVTPKDPVTLDFYDITLGTGKGSGMLKIRQDAVVIEVPLLCETGECVEEIVKADVTELNVNVMLSLGVVVGVIACCLLFLAVLVHYYRGNTNSFMSASSQKEEDNDAGIALKTIRLDEESEQTEFIQQQVMMSDALWEVEEQQEQINDTTESKTEAPPYTPLVVSYATNSNHDDPACSALVWRDVCVNLSTSRSTSRRVLTKVNGCVMPGELVAILGPSGAGKTTLLDVLGGRRGGVSCRGEIKLTGRQKQNTMSYVEQSDLLLETQTVQETILLSAILRSPASTKAAELRKRCTSVMEQLNIEHIACSRIGNSDTGGISGGERKRVSIGIELVVQPALLLLDEPTSGLDSWNVEVLMKVLRRVAKRGCGVLFTIHQVPAHFFATFDQVLLLSRLGRTVFFGSPTMSIKYLSNQGYPVPRHFNPAEFLLEVASLKEDTPLTVMSDDYAESDCNQQLLAHLGSFGPDSPETVHQATRTSNATMIAQPTRGCCSQTHILCVRHLRHISRDLTLVMTHMCVTVIMGAVLGGIFWQMDNKIPGIQNRVGLLFFLTIYFSLTSMSALGTFVNLRKLYWRERASHYYGPFPYFISAIMSDLLPLRVLPPLMFGVICYFMVGFQEDEEKLLYFLLLLVLVNIVATAVCFAVSSASSSVAQGTFVAVIFFIGCMMFGGLFLSNESEGPLTDIRYGSFYFYSYEALMVNEFIGLDLVFNAKGLPPYAITGDVILSNYGMNVARFYCDIYALVGFFVLFLYWAFVLLLFTNSPPKLSPGWKNNLKNLSLMWFLLLLPAAIIAPLAIYVDWCAMNESISGVEAV